MCSRCISFFGGGNGSVEALVAVHSCPEALAEAAMNGEDCGMSYKKADLMQCGIVSKGNRRFNQETNECKKEKIRDFVMV